MQSTYSSHRLVLLPTVRLVSHYSNKPSQSPHFFIFSNQFNDLPTYTPAQLTLWKISTDPPPPAPPTIPDSLQLKFYLSNVAYSSTVLHVSTPPPPPTPVSLHSLPTKLLLTGGAFKPSDSSLVRLNCQSGRGDTG